MTKHLFILLIATALVSCSDMATENPLAGDLPKDFEVSEYSKINPDVAMAQIAIAINKKNAIAKDSLIALNLNLNNSEIADCATFLSDKDLAKDIYLNFVGCPRKGWNKKAPCEGQEAFFGWNNQTYSAETSCSVKGCWSGGWDMPMGIDECPSMGCEFESLSDLWESKVSKYSDRKIQSDQADSVFSTLMAICAFNTLQGDGVPSVQKDKDFIEDYVKNRIDSTLIARHFIMAGRYEGRPYKYCNSNEDELRTSDMAVVLSGSGGEFYDYHANLFCLKEEDGKVYKIK